MSYFRMEARPIFRNISPIDHRYSLSDKALFEALGSWLSEEAAVASGVKAELALVRAHLKQRGPISAAQLDSLTAAEQRLSPEAVYAEEAKTKHHIRALVNVLKAALPPDIAPLVHLGATSADILDSALAFRMKGVVREVVLPYLRRLEDLLCNLADQEAESPQIGRTHGQQAVPITVGFAFAEYVARLGKCIIEIQKRADDLRGKLAGAVGAYNATSLLVQDPEALERSYLAELGLEASEYSTQLVEPEYLLRLLLEINIAFGVIANLADDLRNLQRSEIAEVRENFSADQVGSSTMPQKRNPWNSEHIKSLWKAFAPRVMSFFMDQISEHQRDLTNSASQRWIADYIAGFCQAVARMIELITDLSFNHDRLMANLANDAVLAEAAYILLAASGVSEAHEVIRRLTLTAETTKQSFAEVLAENPASLSPIASKMVELGLVKQATEALTFFSHPERYRGIAAEKARRLAERYWKLMKEAENV